MKKISFGFLFSIMAIVLIVSAAFAEGTALPGSGWWSGEQIQNVGSNDATINITAYDSASTATYEKNDTIAPGAAKTYLPGDFTGMPDGFQGSAIVSSSEDIRAIVNVTNRYLSSLGLGDSSSPSPAAGQYQGMNVPDTTLRFPLVKNDHYGKTTTFFIQNAGSNPATATATFVFPSGVYTYQTPTIAVGAMAVVTPNDARNASNNPPPSGNGVVGSMTATSTEMLAGTSLEHVTSEASATIAQATRAFTPADYDTTVFAPINKNNYYGRFTGLQVQNVSGGPVDINVTYTEEANTNTGCPGGTKTDSATGVADGASATFPSTKLDNGCFAAATVVATGDVVAVVNEAYTSAYLAANPSRHQEATSYGALGMGSATDVISLPLYKEDAYSKGTGISVQNVSDTATAHVVLTFTGPTGTYVSQAQSIAPGSALIVIDVRNKPASFWNGTAMTPTVLGCTNTVNGCAANGTLGVVITSDQPVVAIANESTYPNNAPRISQDKSNYEGFNLTAAP